MTRAIKILMLGATLGLGAGGCLSVNSSLPSSTAVTGEAWYTENNGFLGMSWGSKIWYCPAPTSAGPVTCKEAKLVPTPKDATAKK